MKKNYNDTKYLFFVYSLYFIPLVLIDSTSLYSQGTIFSMFSQLMKILVVVFLIGHLLYRGLTFNQWFLFFLLFSLFTISSYFSKTNFFIFFALFLFSSKYIKLEDFLRYDIYLRSFIIFSVISLNFAGFLQDTILVRYGTQMRHSLGFTSPNSLSVLVFGIVIDYLVIRRKKLKITEFLVLLMLTYILYIVTGSRTACLLILFSLVAFFFETYTNIFNRSFIRLILMISPVIFAIASYCMVTKIQVGSTLFTLINKFTSSRLYFFDAVYNTYGNSLFGQDIPILSADYAKENKVEQLNLDNSYLSLGVRYGLLMLVFIILLLIFIMKKQLDVNDIPMMLVTFLICFYGFSENIIFKPDLSFICFMGSFILDVSKQQVREKT